MGLSLTKDTRFSWFHILAMNLRRRPDTDLKRSLSLTLTLCPSALPRTSRDLKVQPGVAKKLYEYGHFYGKSHIYQILTDAAIWLKYYTCIGWRVHGVLSRCGDLYVSACKVIFLTSTCRGSVQTSLMYSSRCLVQTQKPSLCLLKLQIKQH